MITRLPLLILVFLYFFSIRVLAAPLESVQILDLTQSVIQWIQDYPEITFTGDPNWLPYEAFTRQGEYIGIVADH